MSRKNDIKNVTGDFEEVIYKVKSLINPVITEWRKSL
jgi:hypothetical protein